MHQEGQDILNGALSLALKSTMDRGVHIRTWNSLKDPKLGSICHGNEQDAPLVSGPSRPALPRTGPRWGRDCGEKQEPDTILQTDDGDPEMNQGAFGRNTDRLVDGLDVRVKEAES